VSGPIGMAANDNAVAVVQHIVVEYIKAVVHPMSHRVTINNRTAVDVATIVDVATVNAVVAFVNYAVYNDAAAVENYGVLDKKTSTVNDSTDDTFCAASHVSA